MDHFKAIYAHQAPEYHHMIAVEDVDRHLLPALERVKPLKGKKIIDLGTGTGRLPLLFHPLDVQTVGLDLNRPMLIQQNIQKEAIKGNWPLVEGDMGSLPFASGWADVVIAGWAIGHQTGWVAEGWRVPIGRILHEMHRVAGEDGVIIILETLTTGSLIPAPPNPSLAEYYTWLEEGWGFSRDTISTDYQFNSVEEAVEATEFFFGKEMAEAIQRNGWARLPEWTGVWSKRM